MLLVIKFIFWLRFRKLIHLFLGLFPPLPVHVLEDMKSRILNVIWSRNLNDAKRPIILQPAKFPRPLQIHRHVKFSQNNDWRMMAIISSYVGNVGLKIFFESGFDMVIVA